MFRIFLILLSFGVLACNFQHSENSAYSTKGKAKVEVIGGVVQDLGIIHAPEVLSYTYYIKNTGTAPLILKNVKPTCGCTVANWTTKPVAPGEKASIEVQFDSEGYKGFQRKNVIVETNADNKPLYLYFSVNVK